MELLTFTGEKTNECSLCAYVVWSVSSSIRFIDLYFSAGVSQVTSLCLADISGVAGRTQTLVRVSASVCLLAGCPAPASLLPESQHSASSFFFPPGARGLAEDVNAEYVGQRLQGELVRMENALFGKTCSAVYVVCPGLTVLQQSSVWDRQPPQQATSQSPACKWDNSTSILMHILQPES